jgi:putative hydrolase of the HAD superfamily
MAIVKFDCEGMNAMPKAILLDMDDTILAYDHGVDTDSCWRGAFPGGLACGVEELLNGIKEQAE